jgi:hypothetical protein
MNRLSSSPAFFQHLFAGCAAILVFGASVTLRAQDASSASAVDAPAPRTTPATAPQPVPATVPTDTTASQVPAPTDESSGTNHGSSTGRHQQGRQFAGSGQGHQPQSTEGIHFSLWDRTPLDALQQGNAAHPSRAFGSGGDMSNSGAAFQGADAACLFCGTSTAGAGSAAMGARGGGAPGQMRMGQMNLDQLMRGSAGMDLKSSLGNFRMSYTDGLGGKAGGAMNKGSAQATFNSSSFGGMFNFSAASTLLGSSSMPGGFSSGARGSSMFDSGSGAGGPFGGPDSQRHPTTSLTMRLSF